MKKQHIQSVQFDLIIFVILFSCKKKKEPEQTGDPNILLDLKDDPYCNPESHAYTVSTEKSKYMVIEHNPDYLLPLIKYNISVHSCICITSYKDST